MRAARIILISQVVSLVICAPVLFYVLGFSTHPHHVLSATLTTCVAVLFLGATTRWIYRIKMAQANKLDDAAAETPGFLSS